jgi:hypothetical protein
MWKSDKNETFNVLFILFDVLIFVVVINSFRRCDNLLFDVLINYKDHFDVLISTFWSTKKTISTFWNFWPVNVLIVDVPTPSPLKSLFESRWPRAKTLKDMITIQNSSQVTFAADVIYILSEISRIMISRQVCQSNKSSFVY